ncbi:MAG TPA: phage portal protein, partial [Tissierellaceae bacterium]|nr:phage portal protein [Tissierellaceae bacterium]
PLTIGSELHEADDKDNDVTDIKEIHADNDVDTLNYDLAYDASRYGRGFELHYRDEDNKDVIALVEPFEMFVIRIADVTKEIIGAVHCPIYNGRVHLSIYTDDNIIKYDPFKPEAINLLGEDKKPHQYGIVPVVEWWNNRYRLGDFESQISLIDAYDSAQSDTANYMSDLNDAMLVIEGDVQSTGLGMSDFKTMKDANMLILESGMSADGKERKLSAGYIYKQYDVEGTEAYKQRLLKDYFKLCNVPNLDDEKFLTQSGIALQYKLLGLRQIQTSKEGYFTKALRRRYKLIENIHKELNDTEIQANALTFTFHPNIPEDIWAEVEQFIKAGGDISQETLIELASFTDL